MRFYKFALWKRYFDQGYSLVSYPKWVLAIFGLGEIVKNNYMIVVIGAFFFSILCFFMGWLWLRLGLFEAEQEVSNVYNLFVKQVRRKIKKKDI